MNGLDTAKTYLITGGAGFIGYFLSKRLLEHGARVIGFDNLTDYYDVRLKEERLKNLMQHKEYTFYKGNLANEEDVTNVFGEYHPDIVVNLGAQAGVRYSIDNPESYIESNIIGFYRILEACRHYLASSGVCVFQFCLRRK